MVRSAVADEHLLQYITKTAKRNICSVGLILGQVCLGKDYVIHFAKTPPYQSQEPKSITDVNNMWVADHAHHATRMLPGGMFVLGIFLISPEDAFTQYNSKIVSILSAIHKALIEIPYLHGSGSTEKLVLNYCSKNDKYSAKYYDVNTSRVQPGDIKFLPKGTKWNNMECSYMIDQLYYLKTNEADWPLQKHIKGVLEDIRVSLEKSTFLFNGECKDGDENLESIGKKKVSRSASGKSHHDIKDTNKAMQASIFQSYSSGTSQGKSCHEVFESAGQLRIVGQVACKLWLQPKMSIREASEAIKQDIMRSLCSRLEMHWDSLTEEENSEDINCVHEPPRRVLITLPNTKIKISDYLFPGEGPQDAKAALEELLDIKVKGNLDIQDVEGQADISEYYKGTLESESEEVLPKLPTDANKFMYLVGLGVAFLVLILSLIVHFYR
ncbi:hypothetical protein NQ315_008194 [Exocentrus adspersus]|uniref:Protein odr-4 homolog n=1 Tax=Exocentrus adspersus TaxID=1586481 RepID=A0AAV8VVS5_9CUCU|nr:hypothetical protein NQ315_008194 [Exocentrus adspersus]